jgi:hypothetical protein
MKERYIPGACNIGIEETRKRKRIGWIGLTITLLLWLILVLFDIPRPWRIAVFFPATLSALGFIQARMHFCAYLGFFSLSKIPETGKAEPVEKTEYRKKDKIKAMQIAILSVLTGFIVAIVAYSYP